MALLSFHGTLYAQSYSRDSLEIVINQLEDRPQSLQRDSTLAFFYNDMCEKCIYANDSRADTYLNRFEKKYPSLKWPPAEALYYRARGKYFDKKGDYDQAINLYSKAIKILERYPADPKHLTYTYIMSGFVLTNSGNEAECIRLFRKAEPLALQQVDKANIIWIYDYLGDYALNANKLQEALTYYLKVKKLLPQSSVANQRANNFDGLGKVYLKLGEMPKSLAYFEEGVKIARQNNEGFNLWNLYSNLSYMKMDNGDLDAAESYAKSGLRAAQDFGFTEFISRSYLDLYLIAKKRGDYRASLDYFEKNKVMQDSLGRNELNARYKELELKYEFEKQGYEIEKLEKNRLLLIGYVIVFISLLGFLALVYFRRTNRQLKVQNNLLNDKNEEIKGAILKGSQIERKRVANDLHDSLSTKISALKWRIEAEEPSPLNNEVVNTLAKLYTDVRQIAHNMAAYELQVVGLIPSIENLFGRLNLIEKTKFTLRNNLPEDYEFEPVLAYQLYSVVLELCTNILKHADAGKAFLQLDLTDELLKIYMTDNGTNVVQKSVGIGLRSLKSRVDAFNGLFTINKENGFTVTIEIPVK